ncbi:forkhead box protein M1-like isoform X2 [Gigantopelta aegis]|uniref:forkhead box protein M1-like isoform X2 n=1 Tax=Gigantopelta aegis TaxID=1735272 RepID=UPI001B889542|nr:forkhead box protein M1-like isoform X2 [Gigantopelta aegis]
MSKNNGRLAVNLKSAKCPLNAGQQTRNQHHQPTYIIIYKQKENSDNVNTDSTKNEDTTHDVVRKNLTDIDVDNYDSSFSAAKIFLDDEENSLQCKTAANCHESLKCLDSNFIKKKLFQSRFSPATSACSSLTSVHSNITSVVTPGSSKDEQDSGVFCTPTSGENLKNHAAVRKIVLISPDIQTPLRVQSLASQTLQACTSSPQFSPGFSVPRFPLATSTPVTAADGHCHDIADTPDSGASLTTSFSCSTPGTPFGTSVVNLSTASASSVSSGLGHLQVSEKLSDNRENDGKVSQTDLEAVNTHGSMNEEQDDICLDTSLANIHWLKGYSLPKKKPAAKPATSQGVGIPWMSSNPPTRIQSDLGEIKRTEQESEQCQRPPYSYMTLIQMALHSRDDKKMTLKEICSWVETTFPFYKYTAKPGWKNSIRHNLSFYQCFVRDQAEKKKHGAHWTLQLDEAENEHTAVSNVYVPQSMTANDVPGMIPLFVNSPFLQQANGSLQSFQLDSCNSRKRRTGPMPILPRPSPMQAYALVPIQSVPLQTMQNNPIIVHVPNSLPQQQVLSNLVPVIPSVHTDSYHTQAITLASSVNSVHSSCHSQGTSFLSQQQLNSVYTQQSQNMTMITVTPRECSVETSTTNYSKIQLSSVQRVKEEEQTEHDGRNVIRQAWSQANKSTCESQAPFFQSSSPHRHSCEQMNDPLSEFRSEEVEQKSKRQKTNAGLPKPKMYITRPKKKTRSRVKKQLPKVLEEKELLADSSDSESENKIFSGLPTPLRLLFDSDNTNGEPRITSTPLRNVSFSPDQLPSPIRGLTPLKCNLFDGSFLDNLHEEATRTIKLFGSPINCDTLKTGNSSFSEYGIVQISPDRGLKGQNDSDNKHSLSNLLADFPIDANFMDDGDGLPVDFSVLNWSNLQQQCLNKSGSPSDS